MATRRQRRFIAKMRRMFDDKSGFYRKRDRERNLMQVRKPREPAPQELDLVVTIGTAVMVIAIAVALVDIVVWEVLLLLGW